jgi:hypothetical protein
VVCILNTGTPEILSVNELTVLKNRVQEVILLSCPCLEKDAVCECVMAAFSSGEELLKETRPLSGLSA